MVEKQEGASMICSSCGEKLVCRMSNYKSHPNKLQWQNPDGTAHYKYDNGKFTCNTQSKESKQLKQALREQDEFLKEAELSKGEQ